MPPLQKYLSRQSSKSNPRPPSPMNEKKLAQHLNYKSTNDMWHHYMSHLNENSHKWTLLGDPKTSRTYNIPDEHQFGARAQNQLAGAPRPKLKPGTGILQTGGGGGGGNP